VSQFLAKRWPAAEVTVFEALPTPYGLIRYGVAADHQGAKSVTRQFDRLFTRSGVRFAGNVTVGRDIAFQQIANAFDVVVLAMGLPSDRGLDIPHHPNSRILGAGTLLRALNGYPARELPRDDADRVVSLGRRITVVGMGNVSVDVIRVLSKGAEHFAGSDIDDDLLARLRVDTPLTFDVIGRSPVNEAKFDLAMMRELIGLPNLEVHVTGIGGGDDSPAAQLLRPFMAGAAPRSTAARGHQLNLHFELNPQRVDATNGLTVLHAGRRHDGQTVTFAADTLITAIGFTHANGTADGSPATWSGANVYRVGWFSRGATGTIPENRKDAQRVAEAIIDDVLSGRIPLAKNGFHDVEQLLEDRIVTFADWQRIETFERGTARPNRCRQKLSSIEQMIAVAKTPARTAATPMRAG